jgi:hypothetical protein
MQGEPGKIVMEEVTDPVEIAKAREQRQRADRSWAWLQSRGMEVYDAHRGKCICVAGEEVFAGDTATEALRLAAEAHPEDNGRIILYVPKEKMERIYGPLLNAALRPLWESLGHSGEGSPSPQLPTR